MMHSRLKKWTEKGVILVFIASYNMIGGEARCECTHLFILRLLVDSFLRLYEWYLRKQQNLPIVLDQENN